ncbi:unnamed protein product [Musa textilis]
MELQRDVKSIAVPSSLTTATPFPSLSPRICCDERHLIQKLCCRVCRRSSSHKFPSTEAWQQITGRTGNANPKCSLCCWCETARRLMIGSTAPTCTYNECKGCRLKCRAEQVPVDAGDPMNSAYRYRCVCHG